MTLLHADPVNAILVELAGCLCNEIDASSAPVCFCGVMPGDQVAWDYVNGCESACGMAWVRLVDAVPANGLGVPNIDSGNCGAAIGIDIEMGIIRCLEFPEGGEPPDAETMLAAAVQQSADMLTMRRAVQCCSQSRDWVMDGYAPLGPQGGVIGGTWSLSMLVY